MERLETFSGNVSTPPTGAGDGVPVPVDVVEQLGADAYLYTYLTGEQSDTVRQSSDIVVRTEPSRAPAPAAAVELRVREGALHVFDPATGLRVP